mmetsp:Transcript_35139/g.92524  ORF Transcript_35139/g.92524 Transcript_35139/m.92524 type:complete len:292 (+) Transcript_35139:151-1026(+)
MPTGPAPPHVAQAISRALRVHNLRALLRILLLADPHLLEGAERGEDGAADPDRELALRRRHGRDDLHLVALLEHLPELPIQALLEAGEERVASCDENGGEQVLFQVRVALANAVEDAVRQALHLRGGCHAENAAALRLEGLGLEHEFARLESLRTQVQRPAVGQLVLHVRHLRVGRFIESRLGRAAQRLLNVGNDVPLHVALVRASRALHARGLRHLQLGAVLTQLLVQHIIGSDGWAAFVLQNSEEVLGQALAAQGGSHDAFLEDVTVVNGSYAGGTTTRIKDKRSRSSA